MLLQFEVNPAMDELSLLAVATEESKVAKPGDEPSANSARTLRVLIADDHEAVRRGLRSAIWGAGWQVCGEATNGREAIAKVQELAPDVVILDVSMPVMG